MSYCPDSSPSAPAVRLREFLSLQYLVSTRVACASHSRSCPAANTSTKAKYFGALVAGLPSGINNRAITSTGISWSWNPSIPATSLEWRRAGTRRLLSRVTASTGALFFLAMYMPRTLTLPIASRAPAWEQAPLHSHKNYRPYGINILIYLSSFTLNGHIFDLFITL